MDSLAAFTVKEFVIKIPHFRVRHKQGDGFRKHPFHQFIVKQSLLVVHLFRMKIKCFKQCKHGRKGVQNDKQLHTHRKFFKFVDFKIQYEQDQTNED